LPANAALVLLDRSRLTEPKRQTWLDLVRLPDDARKPASQLMHLHQLESVSARTSESKVSAAIICFARLERH
jgi:hypothetical protein